MATRDEIIRFLIEAEGQRELENLGREIEGVAKSGDAAEDELRKFTTELERLRGLDKQVRELANLQSGLDKTGDSLRTAEQRLESLQAEFDATANPTAKLTRELDKARAEVGKLTEQQTRQRTALQQTTTALQRQGVDTTRLGEAQKRVRAEVTGLNSRFQEYATRTRAAAEAQRQLKDSAEKGLGALTKLRGILAGLGVALGFREAARGVKALTDIGDAAESSRGRLEVLFGSAEEGNRVFETLRKLAVDTGQDFKAVEEAATRLKRFGIDPLDGTLTALIDQNAKFQGSNEDLLRTIDKLGQAYTRNRLSQRDVVALAEQGIPVFNLLAQATGRSAAEFEELARAGKLGRDEISVLIRQIGTEFAGGAQENLSQLSTIVQRLRNQWEQFLLTISDSGVLDFAKRKLGELSAEVERLSNNGDLQRYAQSISDGIVRTAEAIGRAIQFVRDYSGALLALGKAYLAIKFAPFLLGMARSAQAMLAAATQAKATAASIGGLGGAIAKIPTAIKIGVSVVAVDFAINQFLRLNEAIKSYQQALRDGAEFESSQRSLDQDRLLLAQQFQEVYAKYADTAIKSQKELGELGEFEIQQYERRLKGAEKFFVGLAESARVAGDELELRRAREGLERVRSAIGDVGKAFDALKKARQAALEDNLGAARLQESLKLLNVSAQNLGATFTEEGQKITEAFTTVALNAEATAGQIGEAFSNALGRLQTTAEVERLGNALEEAFRRGKISAEQFEALTKLAEERLSSIKDTAAKAAGSFKQIEEAGEAAIRATLATLQSNRAALENAAAALGRGISEKLAAGATEEAAALQRELDSVKARLETTNGKIAESEGALRKLGEQAKATGDSLRGAAEGGVRSFNALTESIEGARASYQSYAESTDKVAKAEAKRAADTRVFTTRQIEDGERLLEVLKAQAEQLNRTLAFTPQLARGLQSLQEARLEAAREELALQDQINARIEARRQLEREALDAQLAGVQQVQEQLAQTAVATAEAQERTAEAVRSQAAGLGEAVTRQQTLNQLRSTAPPERIELTAANRQKPGEILSELSERDIAAIAQRIVGLLGSAQRGGFRR